MHTASAGFAARAAAAAGGWRFSVNMHNVEAKKKAAALTNNYFSSPLLNNTTQNDRVAQGSLGASP